MPTLHRLLLLAGLTICTSVSAQQPVVFQAVVGDTGAATPEISTDELKRILAEQRVPVLDVRSAQEYAIAHIPGSLNYYEKELEQITQAYPDPATALVFYCNGPYCGKSKRLSAELRTRGYTAVRRYQLGLPVWRALGNTVQTDLAGMRYIMAGDRTAVLVDARGPEAFREGSLPKAVSVRRGEAEAANEDGRLPYRDKGTRVLVFGDTPAEARAVAEEIAHKAYWNSSYFGGSYRELAAVAGR
ncbi:MAG TPA: rhodanese-like domain-containing protein [Gemmatimonadales bacterium]|nr:rhodanese-like domain-containing protein [Gemmatimonadales bacterium]